MLNHATPLLTHALGANTLLQIKPLGTHAGTQPAHRHDFCELFVLQEAAGHHQIDFVEFPLLADRIYFIGVGQVHTLRATHLDGWLLAFDPAFLAAGEPTAAPFAAPALFNNWQRQPYIDLAPADQPAFSALLLLLRQEYDRAAPCYHTLRHYLQALLLNAVRVSDANAGAPTPSLSQTYILRLQQLMEQHYPAHRPATFYADQLELPAKRLNDYTRRTLGKSVTQLLHQRLLVESKRLLLYSPLTVKEVAYAVGFTEPAYFSRFFKHQTGQYPEPFRQDWAKTASG